MAVVEAARGQGGYVEPNAMFVWIADRRAARISGDAVTAP